MSSKLKIACAALAVLAVSAMGTAPAQASSLFEASEYPAEIVGSQIGIAEFEVEELGTMECEVVTVEGELTAPSSAVAVTPNFENCIAEGLEVTYENDGECKFIAYSGEELEEDEFDITMDVSCAEQGGGFKFHLPFADCIISIGGQVGIGNLTSLIHKLVPLHISIIAATGEVKAAIENTPPDKCVLPTGMIKFTVNAGITVKAKGGVSLFIK